MLRKLSIAVFGVGLLMAMGPVLAHHAFTAEFDANRPVKLEGPITKLELINPHTWIHMEVKRPDGKVEQWMVEGGTPNTLLRQGITKNTVKIGTVITVVGHQAKDGSLRANGRDLVLPDGRKLFIGSPGTGGPDDRRDPTVPR